MEELVKKTELSNVVIGGAAVDSNAQVDFSYSDQTEEVLEFTVVNYAEDAVYAAECLKRFPEDRKREPIPFTHAQEAVRKKMWNRDYLLPDDEELLTDNRTNVYWDEETNRSEKLERDAIEAGLSVIRYEDMFPDMGNEMSSCKGADCNGRQFYQMSR